MRLESLRRRPASPPAAELSDRAEGKGLRLPSAALPPEEGGRSGRGSGSGSGGLSAQQIKCIAVAAMVGDHLAWWLLPTSSVPGMLLHFFGRITAPVMCYFVAEGCYHTSHLGRYLLRLLLCALPSHFAYVFYFRRGLWETTSVIWGLLCGLAALSVWRLCSGRTGDGSPLSVRWPSLLVTAGAAAVCCRAAAGGDWSYTTVLWILACGLFHGQFRRQMAALSAVGLACYLLPAWARAGGPVFYTLGIFLALPLLAAYNGRRSNRQWDIPGGRRRADWSKWGFYLFYPLHLGILGILRNGLFPF